MGKYTRWTPEWLNSHQIECRKLGNSDVKGNKAATPITIDFRYVMDVLEEPMGHQPFRIEQKLDPDFKLLTVAHIKKRVNRRRHTRGGMAEIKSYELAVAYANKKPLEEWDTEELARGRPRNKDGSFTGPKPQYVSMAMHEEAVDKFAQIIRTDMNVATIQAVKQLQTILDNDELDYRGKPIISPSVKLDAAKFLVEHIVGKPKQHIENDVSIKLQAILGQVIVNPGESDDGIDIYEPAHLPGVTMELASREQSNDQSAG